jgi:hypothetical protein
VDPGTESHARRSDGPRCATSNRRSRTR